MLLSLNPRVTFTSFIIIVRVNQFRRGWAGHIPRVEESRSPFKILTDKSPGKKPLAMPRRRWEDKIRIYL